MLRIAAIVALVAAASAVGFVVTSYDPCAFDADRWRAATADKLTEAERYQQSSSLVKRIVECGGIVGDSSRAEVRALLGEPSEEWRSAWRYSLGTHVDFLGDRERMDLAIRFDADEAQFARFALRGTSRRSPGRVDESGAP